MSRPPSKPNSKPTSTSTSTSKSLYVDTKPHGASKVINPKDLDKPNILDRAAYDECFIFNSTVQQLYNKALFNVVRALKKGSKCKVEMDTNDDANKVAEEGKIAGFLNASVSGTTVVLTK